MPDLAGATNIKVISRCIEQGPEGPGDIRRAIWDFRVTYQEPKLLTRLAKAALRNIPGIKTLIEGAEAIEDEHQDQIVNRDNIIDERTADLAKANQTMRLEIADRKMAEAALRQNKDQLQRYITAIDEIGLGLCVIDADYRLQVMNSTLKNWFGNHLGKTCYSSLMGREHPCEQCKMQDVIEQGKKVRYYPSIPDGRIWILLQPQYIIMMTPFLEWKLSVTSLSKKGGNGKNWRASSTANNSKSWKASKQWPQLSPIALTMP
jgi:PAS domain-containing protein